MAARRKAVARAAVWAALLAAAMIVRADETGAAAEEPPGTPADAALEDTPGHDERALAVAKRMAATLAGASALRVTMEIVWDAIQADRRSVEFGATRHVTIRRPDRARMDVLDRSGDTRRFVYDGRRIALADDTAAVYATAAFSGDLDAMLGYVREDLGLRTPLAELLSRDPYERLAALDTSAWAGQQTLDGVPCDHVLFRTKDEVGVQLWVPSQGAPLPRRIVIDYEWADGRPSFRASLRDWERSPRLADDFFAFVPADDAELISFRAGGELLAPAPRPEDRP